MFLDVSPMTLSLEMCTLAMHGDTRVRAWTHESLSVLSSVRSSPSFNLIGVISLSTVVTLTLCTETGFTVL